MSLGLGLDQICCLRIMLSADETAGAWVISGWGASVNRCALAFSVWAIALPDDARISMKAAVDWIATNLGWYYVVTVTLVIGFVLWVALSQEGNVWLGPDHSRSQMFWFEKNQAEALL